MQSMKKMTTTLILFSIIMSLSSPIYADSLSTSNEYLINQAIENTSAMAKITDNVTGEEIILEATIVNIEQLSSSRNSDSQFSVSYEVEVPLNLLSRVSAGFNGDNDYATANVTAVYSIHSTGELIRVERIHGGWSVSNSIFYLTDRSCGASSGGMQYSISKYPTSNSFNYSTGWGYVDRVGGDLGPHVWSDVEVWVSGMEAAGSKNLNLLYGFGGY